MRFIDRGVQQLRKLFKLSYRKFDRRDSAGGSGEVVESACEEVEQTYSSGSVSGRTSHKFYPEPVTQQTLNPTWSGRSVGKYMTDIFNAYCTEMGVQCTVTMDPTDYQQLYALKNISDKLLRIEYDRMTFYLEPNESMTFKTKAGEIPILTPINYGNTELLWTT